MYRSRSHFALIRIVALLISAALFLNSAGHTVAYMFKITPTLINTFLPGLEPAGDLVIGKEVTHPFGPGYQVPEGLEFTFTVALGGAYANKTVQTSQGSKTADETGNITVTVKPGEAVRVKDLPEGTSITITEAAAPGFTADDGNIKTLTINSGDNDITYTNVYAPSPVDPVNLSVTGTKFLEGREWQEGDCFTFLLEYKLAGSDAEWQTAGTASVTYDLTNPDFNKFSFTELVQGLAYSSAGEYSFRVSEVAGTIGGIEYDKVVSYFDILVGDADMDGSLEVQSAEGYQNAKASYDAETNIHSIDLTINNTYAPAGSAAATIHISKTVDSLSGEEKSFAGFTFQLYDQEGNLVKTSPATSAAGETAIELTFDAKNAGQTFYYTLKETNAGQTINGMAYDKTEYPIAVSVVDNLDGTVSAYIYEAEAPQSQPLIELPLETIPQETIPEVTEPEETIPEQTEPEETEPVETEPVVTEPEVTEPVVTEPVVTEPVVTEPVVTEPVVTEPVVTQPVVTEPVVTEPAQTQPLFTEEPLPPSSASAPPTHMPGYDPSFFQEPETVTGDEDAVIPADATDTWEVSFRNVYDPRDTKDTFTGKKELSGRGLNKGEFTFDLYYTGEGFTVTDAMSPLQTVTNGADGTITFWPLAYDKVGTWRYVVKENASKALGGILYDDAVFHITVTVTDEGGALKAVTTYTDDLGNAADMIFRNTYAPAKATAIFTGTKTLTGKTLEKGMFDFLLYSADPAFTIQGEAMDRVSNDENGGFAFDKIEYTEAGEYFYVIAEDDSDPVKGMTYDDTVYGVKVTVTDDGAGQLTAAAAYYENGGQVDAVLFENSYEEPPTETTEETTAPTETSEETTAPTETSEETTVPTETETKPTETKPPKPTIPADKDSPDTGDRYIRMYIVTMLVSFAAILLLLPMGKPRKKGGRYLR